MGERFGLEELKKSHKYCRYRDVLAVVLNENEEYTLEQADEAIKEFMDREV